MLLSEMMANSNIFIPLVLFLITVGFGFWVSKVGRPYHSGLFNIHKLFALAGVVLAVLRFRPGFSIEALTSLILLALGLTGFSVILLFASGAVMSIREDEPGIALLIHRAGPVIITICLAGMLFLS
jgi:hypothetical protein